ncbi:outer membrane beta-barrel protein [Roseivirga thermotolerans]|nr:outer membrane beta-barrel protein [Roseivirga thermotolerans]
MKLRVLCLTLIVILMSQQPMFGQESYSRFYQAGPVAKLLTAKMTLDNSEIDLAEGGSEIGYQFGFFFRANVENVYVQPSVLLSKIKTQLVFLNYDNVPNFNPRADFEFNTLELPVDIGYRIGNLRLQMGPSFSILLSGHRSFLNEIEKVSDSYNRTSMMWHFGLGGDFDRVMIDINYEFGLSKTGESLGRLLGREFIPKQRQWVISVGLNFLNDY